jgi:hypothetical protein
MVIDRTAASAVIADEVAMGQVENATSAQLVVAAGPAAVSPAWGGRRKRARPGWQSAQQQAGEGCPTPGEGPGGLPQLMWTAAPEQAAAGEGSRLSSATTPAQSTAASSSQQQQLSPAWGALLAASAAAEILDSLTAMDSMNISLLHPPPAAAHVVHGCSCRCSFCLAVLTAGAPVQYVPAVDDVTMVDVEPLAERHDAPPPQHTSGYSLRRVAAGGSLLDVPWGHHGRCGGSDMAAPAVAAPSGLMLGAADLQAAAGLSAELIEGSELAEGVISLPLLPTRAQPATEEAAADRTAACSDGPWVLEAVVPHQQTCSAGGYTHSYSNSWEDIEVIYQVQAEREGPAAAAAAAACTLMGFTQGRLYGEPADADVNLLGTEEVLQQTGSCGTATAAVCSSHNECVTDDDNDSYSRHHTSGNREKRRLQKQQEKARRNRRRQWQPAGPSRLRIMTAAAVDDIIEVSPAAVPLAVQQLVGQEAPSAPDHSSADFCVGSSTSAGSNSTADRSTSRGKRRGRGGSRRGSSTGSSRSSSRVSSRGGGGGQSRAVGRTAKCR